VCNIVVDLWSQETRDGGSDNPSVIPYLWGMLRANSCNNPSCKDNLKAWNGCWICFLLRHCMKVIGDLQYVLLGLWATDVWWMYLQQCYGGSTDDADMPICFVI
jgi:hypothetical protein